MSQAASTSTSGSVYFADANAGANTFRVVAVIVAALLLAFIVFRKTK